jgi:hypothetical protein
MTSKRFYLLLMSALLMLSVGTGFALHSRPQSGCVALRALETASFHLERDTNLADTQRHKVLALV